MFATVSPPLFLTAAGALALVIHITFALARQITNTLLALPEFQNSASVSCFLSMPTGEVDTSAVVAAVLGSGAHRASYPHYLWPG